MRTVTALAPTRIDLAGGTLDLPPLFLFHRPALTINIGIDRMAKVTLSTASKDFVIASRDQGEEARGASVQDIPWTAHPKLELLIRLVASFQPAEPLAVAVEAQVPAGSGLGGSSAVAIALTAALARWFGRKFSPQELVEYAKSHETQTIRVPTGYQDYWAAMYGGLHAYEMGLDGNVRRTPLGSIAFRRQLTEHLMLVYVGKPHFSGANNWQLFKQHIDNDLATVEFFERLKHNALAMQEALSREDLARVTSALNLDWQTRKAMLPGMTTPEIEYLAKTAFQHGALALRVCGAGAGGCAVLMVKPDARDELQQLIKRELHMQVLPVEISENGVTVTET